MGKGGREKEKNIEVQNSQRRLVLKVVGILLPKVVDFMPNALGAVEMRIGDGAIFSEGVCCEG